MLFVIVALIVAGVIVGVAALTDSVGLSGKPTGLHGKSIGRQVDGRARSNPRFSLRRQVARVFMVGFNGRTTTAPFLKRYARRGWGGVVLDQRNYADPAQLQALTDAIAATAKTAGFAAPLIAAAQIGGRATAFAGLPPIPQPDITSPRQAGREATAAASELRARGVNMTLAPVADVGDPAGPFEDRVFADDPGSVAARARSAVSAYATAGIISAPGAFPGQGAASQNPQAGPASVGLGLADLRARDLVPYRAIARRLPVVVISNAAYASYDGVTPAVLLPEVIAGLLRHDLGFRGVAMSDDLLGTQAATGGAIGTDAVDALRAGIDLLYVSDDTTADRAAAAVVAAVKHGRLSRARIASAVSRIAALARRYRVGR